MRPRYAFFSRARGIIDWYRSPSGWAIGSAYDEYPCNMEAILDLQTGKVVVGHGLDPVEGRLVVAAFLGSLNG